MPLLQVVVAELRHATPVRQARLAWVVLVVVVLVLVLLLLLLCVGRFLICRGETVSLGGNRVQRRRDRRRS